MLESLVKQNSQRVGIRIEFYIIYLRRQQIQMQKLIQVDGAKKRFSGKALGILGTAMDVKELYDSYQEDGGKIGENTVTSAGGIAGGWAGAAVGAKGGAMGGAALGTLICPGIGTAIGGFIGGLAGGIFGGLGGRWAGEKLAGAAYD